jgi:hypothetical protein
MHNDGVINRTVSFKMTLIKLGLVNSPRCERCNQDSETISHVLFNCEAMAILCFRHIGQHFINPGHCTSFKEQG